MLERKKVATTSAYIVMLLNVAHEQIDKMECSSTMLHSFHARTLLAGITGYRTGCLEELRYQDFQVGLIRDRASPEDGNSSLGFPSGTGSGVDNGQCRKDQTSQQVILHVASVNGSRSSSSVWSTRLLSAVSSIMTETSAMFHVVWFRITLSFDRRRVACFSGWSRISVY